MIKKKDIPIDQDVSIAPDARFEAMQNKWLGTTTRFVRRRVWALLWRSDDDRQRDRDRIRPTAWTGQTHLDVKPPMASSPASRPPSVSGGDNPRINGAQ
jgi:hypothetical protein